MPARPLQPGRRAGCLACDSVFRIQTNATLATVPCPYCGAQGTLLLLPLPGTWPHDVAEEDEEDEV